MNLKGGIKLEIGNSNLTVNDTNSLIHVATTKREVLLQNKFLQVLNKTAKRTIDILGAIVGILTLIPLTIIVFILNRIHGEKGKIFYSHERIGKDGKLFRMYKYRTMVENADEILEKCLAENEEMRKEFEKSQKFKDDPRITKVGKFLRETSLDEFPQFINVLKGEMSLVGPRPYLPRERKEIGEYYNYIIKCKPGVTGLWQVSGRSNMTFQERLDLDIEYYKDKSFNGDVKLLLKTVAKTLKHEGAV